METRKKKSFKRLFAFLMAFVMVTTLAVSAVFAAPTFSDVPASHEFYDDIEFLYAEGVVKGYGSTGKYGPADLLTRAQAAKMVAIGAGFKDSDGAESKLVDVDETTDMAGQIWALEKAGVVKGFGKTNEFRPDLDITRGHVAKMVAQAFELDFGKEPVLFTDLPDDEEVAEAIEILASLGIVQGYGKTGLIFKPDDPVTRGQFAKIVAGAMRQLPVEEILSVHAITTVVNVTDGELEFTINNETKPFDYENRLPEGYEVKFVSDKGVFLPSGASFSDKGLLTDLADLNPAKFDYKVEIYDDEGDLVAESKRVTVKVEVFDEIVTEINSIKLYVGDRPDNGTDDRLEVTSGKVDKKELQVHLVVEGKVKSTKGAKDVDITELVAFTSSKNAIATVKAESEAGDVVLHGALGKVTITAKADGKAKTLTFEVVDVVSPRGVSASNSSVAPKAIKDGVSASFELEAIIKDALGEPISGLETAVFVLGDSLVLTSAATTEDAKIAGTYKIKGKLAATATEGAVDVDVVVDGVTIGTIKVTIVAPGATVASYEVKAEETKLDIIDDEEPEASTSILVLEKDKDGYVKTEITLSSSNVLASAANPEDKKYVVESSDFKVADFNVSTGKLVGAKVGTAKISVYQYEGSIKVLRGSVVIEVIDSTPELDNVVFLNIPQFRAAGSVEVIDEVVLKGSGEYDEDNVTFTGSGEVITISYDSTNVGTLMLFNVPTGIGATLSVDSNVVKLTVDASSTAAKTGTVELVAIDAKGKIVAETSVKVVIPKTA